MTGGPLSVRRPVALGLAALVALLAGFGLWATQTQLSGAIVAPGQIVVQADRQVIQHPDGGVVSDLLVSEGSLVAAGDLLLRLDGAGLQSDLRIVEDRLSELTARAARLVAERDGDPQPDFPGPLRAMALDRPDVADQIDGQLRLFAARRATLAEAQDQLARRIDQVHAQRDGLAAQQSALETQLALVRDELASRQSLLDKGLMAQTSVLALRREAASLTGQIGEVAAGLARLAEQVTEIEIQRSALLTRRQEEAAAELRDIAPMVLELTETRRALLGRIDRLDLRAPVAGIVLGLQGATPRAVLRAADPVLSLVPQDRPLEIAARIAPSQVDEVRLGQTADLVILAFGGADAPRLRAQVTLISADALADPQTGAAYFLVRLGLPLAESARLGDLSLLPGMPVEVFFQTGSRTPLAYLLEPFTDYFNHALRES